MIRYPLIKRVYWSLKGYPAQRLLSLLEESQWWPKEKLSAFRNEKLAALIRHCYQNVPYYRQVMDERKLTPADITQIADLPKLPLLTKQIVRQNNERLWASNIPASQTGEARTGGTTGEPMCIRRRPVDVAWQRQCCVRGLSWGGLLPNTPKVALFGGSLGLQEETSTIRKILTRLLEPKDVLLPAYELKRNNVMDYVSAIRSSSCRHMIGYSSSVYWLAHLAEEQGESFDFEAIFTTADMLLPEWRQTIARVFNCKVLPYYGCGEVNSLGFQCGQGESYHQCDEHAVMEVLLADGSTSFEGEGPFVITDLDNYSMPILRYENGDAGVLSDAPCQCGRSSGQITRLDGRVRDMLLTSEGDFFPGGIGSYIFKHLDGVVFWQVVQDRPGQVLVRIVPADSYDRTKAEKDIKEVLGRYLGNSPTVDIEYPEAIERTPAGKARYVINRYLERTSGSAAVK